MSESAWKGYPPIEERDAEIERLRDAEVIARTTQANLHEEIVRLRGLLRYAVPAGDAPKDWYQRVREALGE